MTLTDILIQTSQIFLKSPATASDREWLLFYINMACREMWQNQDLRESLREETYMVGANKIIALPPDVGELRAIRNCCEKATIVSRIARYQSGSWAKEDCYQFTQLGTGPLSSSGAYNHLKIEVLAPDTCKLTVNITGSTPYAKRKVYSTDFDAGETEKIFSTDLVGIDSIMRSRQSDSDIVVYSLDDEDNQTEISNIPNDRVEARFLLIQIGSRLCACTSDCSTPYEGRHFDVLYKLPFVPLVNDTDVFPIDGRENNLFYKLMEVKQLTSLPNGTEAIGILSQKQQSLKEFVNVNQTVAVTQKIDLGVNPWNNLTRPRRYETL